MIEWLASLPRKFIYLRFTHGKGTFKIQKCIFYVKECINRSRLTIKTMCHAEILL